jgi:hypothetical protein
MYIVMDVSLIVKGFMSPTFDFFSIICYIW